MKLVLLGEAEREFAESVTYYELKEPGLGRRFRNEVVQAVAKIARRPELSRVRPKGYRRYNLRVFPHYVAYVTREDKDLDRSDRSCLSAPRVLASPDRRVRRQRLRDSAEVVEQNLHVAQGGTIVQDAAAQGEPAANRGIGKVRAAIILQGDEQTFVERVDRFRRSVFQPCREMTEAEDGKFGWREHFEVVTGPDQRLQVTCADDVIFDCPA